MSGAGRDGGHWRDASAGSTSCWTGMRGRWTLVLQFERAATSARDKMRSMLRRPTALSGDALSTIRLPQTHRPQTSGHIDQVASPACCILASLLLPRPFDLPSCPLRFLRCSPLLRLLLPSLRRPLGLPYSLSHLSSVIVRYFVVCFCCFVACCFRRLAVGPCYFGDLWWHVVGARCFFRPCCELCLLQYERLIETLALPPLPPNPHPAQIKTRNRTRALNCFVVDSSTSNRRAPLQTPLRAPRIADTMQAQGPAASTRQRTALGDLSNKYSQIKDPVRGNKVRPRAGLCHPALAPQRARASAQMLVAHKLAISPHTGSQGRVSKARRLPGLARVVRPKPRGCWPVCCQGDCRQG